MTLDPGRLFAPSRALRAADVGLFAGREQVLSSIVQAIAVTGSTVVIFGDRGIGKTTLASMASLLLDRDEGLSTRFGPALQYLDTKRFRSLWVECDPQCVTFSDVLRKLFVSSAGRWDRTIPDLSPGLAPLLGGGADDRDWAVQSALAAWTETIIKSEGIDEVVIFVDEFDRLPDKSGLAQFAKNATGCKLKVTVIF